MERNDHILNDLHFKVQKYDILKDFFQSLFKNQI